MSYSRKLIQTLFALSIAAVAASQVIAGQVAFQNFEDGSGPYYVLSDIGCSTYYGGNIAQAQEFTAGVSGAVESVSAFLSQGRFDSYPLTVDIRSVTNDDLPGASLGIATRAASGANPSSLTTIEFLDSIVELTAGTNYYAVFTVPNRPYNQRLFADDYAIWTVANDSRSSGFLPVTSGDGGMTFSSYHYNFSLEFGLVVTVVPEPATASLLLTAAWLVTSYYRPIRRRML